MKKFTCEECLAYCICPQKPKREDYSDENKYLIDLECGVWSCKNTVQELCKENGKLKEQIEKMKCCENCQTVRDVNGNCYLHKDGKCDPKTKIKWELK